MEIIEVFEDKCVGCNKCIAKCPAEQANVSYIKNGKNVVKINSDKCIVCGNCIDICDHDARGYQDDTETFFADLKKGQKISVIAAPSIRYNVDKYKNLFGFLKSKSVNLIYDVAFGAEMTIWAYLKVIKERNGDSMIAQPCPAIVLFIEKYYPELIDRLAPIHSPALCTAVYLKKYKHVADKIAFLSPCIGKAEEFSDTGGYVNYNVTYKKLEEYIRKNKINLMDFPEENFDDDGCGIGFIFSRPGGLSENITYHTDGQVWLRQVEGDQGYQYVKEYAKRIENGKKTPQLVDILNCTYGCNLGTGTCKQIEIDDIDTVINASKVEKIKQIKEHGLCKENYALFEQFDKEIKLEDFIRTYRDKSSPIDKKTFAEKEYSTIFAQMHKVVDSDRNINCFACGYGNCQTFVRAVLLGNNHLGNCINFNRAEVDIEKHQVEEKGKEIDDLQNMIDEIQELNSELEYSKKNLVEQERENRGIFSAIPDLMFIMNSEGVILKVKEGSFTPVFSLQNVIGKNIGELAAEEDVCLVMENILGALEDGDVKTIEYALTKNKSMIYRELRFVATGKDQVLVLIKDISERKQMENSITETSERQRLFNEILGILYDPLDWQDSLRLACEKIARFTGVSGVCIFEDYLDITENPSQFYVWSHGGVIPENENLDWLAAVQQWQVNLETNGYIQIADAEHNWPLEVVKPKQIGRLKSLLAFPLCIGNQISGHLAFIEIENLRWETEGEMEEFYSLSNLLLFIISGAIERKRSQDQLIVAQENTQRKNKQIALLYTDLQQNMAIVTNLLNNTGQGILSFGSGLCISAKCSSECSRIFNSDIVGKNAMQLLFNNDPEKEVYGDVFVEIFRSKNLFRQNLLLELLPEKITVEESIFAAKYKIIGESIDSDKKQVMMIMTDITAQVVLEEQIEKERELQSMMVRVIEQYDSFTEIIKDFKWFLMELENDTVMIRGNEGKWKEDLYRQVHTFKGNFSMFGLQYLARCLHELEDYITMEDSLERMKMELASTQLGILKKAYSMEWNTLIEIFGNSFFKRQNYVQVESERIIGLEKMLSNKNVVGQVPEVFHELKRWQCKKLSEMILRYKNYVVELGLRMDKKIHPLIIVGADVLVEPAQYKEFVHHLIHIFRNIVDHGIETPEERVDRGKDEYGQIKCEIFLKNGGLYVEISDDGRGIDVENVRIKAVENGVLSQADGDAMEDSRIIELIFNTGFSTKKKVSDISGRGIGLVSVKKIIEKMGGQVTASSQSGIGTTFRFFLGKAYIVN